MNAFDLAEMALIETSRLQREALAAHGMTLVDIAPLEAARLAAFVARSSRKENR